MRNKNKLASMKKYIKYIIILAFLILTIIIVVSTLLKRNSKEDEKPDDRVTWTLEIPENYSIKENYMFYCEYFTVYYSQKDENYSVIINKYDNYNEDDIKKWIFEQLIKFDDGENITEENTNFNVEIPDYLI